MPFALHRLLQSRPYLFHLTAASNLESISRTLLLRSANELLTDAGLKHRSSQRRLAHLTTPQGNESVHIRDQAPLIEGAISFEDGWDMPRLVQHINDHVFFWPGNLAGPIEPGRKHFERYRSESPVILRVPTAELLGRNIKFSRYNSGAPRCSGGKYSPRGSKTYVPASEFVGTASEVVEVVVVGTCALSSNVEVSCIPTGPWRRLRSAA
jgi:hypothetical protein